MSAYSKEDKHIFFGRDEETKLLYDLVKKNRVVLLYGPSGTGKTSLVSCGLAGKFETTDWFPVKISRGENINDSLVRSLAIIGNEIGVLSSQQLKPQEIIEEIYSEYLRPVYLIFDQFEELFVFGSRDEIQVFMSTLKSIIDAQLACRILIIIREEYLARLYQFEKTIPSILDRRLRVEPMLRDNLLTVVKSSCASFNVGFDSPDRTPQKIVDNLEHVRSGMALPYLQVYLDMLYKRDFRKTFKRERVGEEMPELKFSLEEVEKIGDIENVLELFLTEQVSDIEQRSAASHPVITRDFIFRILDVFVSENATKRPVAYVLQNGYKTLPNDLFPGIEEKDQSALRTVIRELELNRVLLDNEGSLELAHDSLAALIDKTRSEEQRRINRIRKRLENAFYEYESSGVLLNKEQLYDVTVSTHELQPYLKGEWLDFISKSKAAREKEENLALAREQKKRRTAMIVAIVGFVLAGLAMIAFIDARSKSRQIVAQALEIEALQAQNARNLIEQQVKIAGTLKENGNYQEAVDVINSTESFAKNANLPWPDSLEIVKNKWMNFAKLVARGDSLVRLGELDEGKKIFESVEQQDSNQIVKYKVLDTQYRIDEYKSNYLKGNTFEASGRPDLAKDYYRKALQAKPNDTRVLLKLRAMN